MGREGTFMVWRSDLLAHFIYRAKGRQHHGSEARFVSPAYAHPHVTNHNPEVLSIRRYCHFKLRVLGYEILL